MRNLSGYNFKDGAINEGQRKIFDEYIHVFGAHNVFDGASEMTTDNRTYLFRTARDPLFIYGIGNSSANPTSSQETIGVVWGCHEDNMRQALYYADDAHQLFDKSFPFKVVPNVVYIVENGQIFHFLKKGDKVKTPDGIGHIFSIDELHDVCVELENDNSVYYEYSIKELEKIKE